MMAEGGRRMFELEAELRLRNGAIARRRRELGLTQKEAAEAVGISYPYWNTIENMKAYPSEDVREKIGDLLGVLAEDIFPIQLQGYKAKAIRSGRMIDPENILRLGSASTRRLAIPASFDERVEHQDVVQKVRQLLSNLSPREQQVISLCYGIDCEPHTLEEVAVIIGVTTERARQIRNRVFEKIRERPLRRRVWEACWHA
jgi:RNA polymerase sigma factor (sigma-70 family)